MSSGSVVAAVPTTMRDAPASANRSAVSKSRMPPPAWIFTVKRFAIWRMASRFAGVPVRESFMTAASPGVVALFFQNRYYANREAYLTAIADALRVEYRAVVEAGFVLHAHEVVQTHAGAGVALLEPVEGLGGGVGLVVVFAVGECTQFVQVGREPVGGCGQVDEAVFDHAIDA